MKTYKLLFTGVCAVAMSLSLASCDDFLRDNTFPLDTQTDNPAYWNNESNVETQCNYFYSLFTGFGSGQSGDFYFPSLNDDKAGGTGGGFTNWSNTNIPTSSTLWSNPYAYIRRAEIIMQGVQSSTLSESKKDRFIAIARMWRAIQYYWLVRRYGDVPYVDNVVGLNDSILYAPRDNRDMVMDKALEDLNFAVENIGAGTKTTWSSNLANAVKAEVCLFEGTYAKYRTAEDNGYAPDQARAEKYLNACVDACNALMGGAYSLCDSYISLYNTPNNGLGSNPEIILYKQYMGGETNTLTHATIAYTCSSTEQGGMSKDAFDSYRFLDGKPLATTTLDTNDAGYVKDNIVINSAGLKNGTQINPTYGKALYIGDVLAVRDQRLYQTIDTIVTYSNGYPWMRAGANNMTSCSGYTFRKFDNPEAIDNTQKRTQIGQNYTSSPIYWYAQILLAYAEAKAELGTITQEDYDKTINALAARANGAEAGISNVKIANIEHDPANNMGVSDVIWEIRCARRAELMVDGLRWWDLVRWHQLDKLDSTQYPTIMMGANLKNVDEEHMYKNMSTIGGYENYMRPSPAANRIYESRQYFYPIPSGQITLNPNLKQQPKWAN